MQYLQAIHFNFPAHKMDGLEMLPKAEGSGIVWEGAEKELGS